MKANATKPPSPDRRRTRRAFAPTAPRLEDRELLSASDFSYVSLSPTPLVGPVSVTATTLPWPSMLSASAAGVLPPPPPAGGLAINPGSGLPIPPGGPPPDGPPTHDRSRLRVGLAEANIRVDGKATPEFAFADAARGVVLVKVGIDGAPSVLAASAGISSPGAVVLSDVNGDGLPDLLVANSGGNNLLVFPGLAGGGVGPEVEGGRGFAVGLQPMGITVCDLNKDGNRDVIVANRGSNDVSLLIGQGSGPGWTMTPGQTLRAGASPVRTAVQDINLDGKPDLFILDSGSNDVTLYPGLGGGRFDTSSPARFAVGTAPSELFVGRFDRRPGFELVTVNTGSDDVSFISGIGTSTPRTMTFTSGGSQPDAAFAVDLNHDGFLDLVVANSGDGRVALLQGSINGLQLAGVITRPDPPAPTALAPDYVTGARLDFFAASAGLDAAQLLHFDLGPASDFLSVPLVSSGSAQDDSELIAQLLPFGESELELIAVLWDGERASMTEASDFESHEASLAPVPYAKTVETQPEDDPADDPAEPSPVAVPPEDPDLWVRYVLGIDLALKEPRDLLGEPGTGVDEIDDPRPVADRSATDPDLEAAAVAVDEALRSLRSDGQAPGQAEAPPAEDSGRVGLEGVEEPDSEGLRDRTIPLVASSIAIASRLIFKALPPRPPSIRRALGHRSSPIAPRPDGRSGVE